MNRHELNRVNSNFISYGVNSLKLGDLHLTLTIQYITITVRPIYVVAVVKKLIKDKWSICELTPYLIALGLTHLGLEASK